ncbi:hypothetical protein DFS33DRAFT_1434873 [Desarmillaria ectypa]|nr:hypothetical protein DFS33DRAFT_1434873 [Desarmillaria ectypa]
MTGFISDTAATLGLTLYILAYSNGPMFVASTRAFCHGSNLVFITTLSLFFVSQTPVATEKIMSLVLAFHFPAGFVGSLVFATGDGSMEGGYVMPSHVVGEILAQANGWRWPQCEPIRTACLMVIFILRPKKMTGNQQLRSHSQKGWEESVLMPTNADLGFIYISCWRPSHWSSLTMYKFNTGISGLLFLATLHTSSIRNTALDCDLPGLPIEGIDSAQGNSRTSKASTGLFPLSELPSASSIHLTFQSILIYGMGTPGCLSSASALAGNNLFRSTIASVSPLFGRASSVNLGLGPGSALAGKPVFWAL